MMNPLKEIQKLKPEIKLMIMAMAALAFFMGVTFIYVISPEPKLVQLCQTRGGEPWCISGNGTYIEAELQKIRFPLNVEINSSNICGERTPIIVHDCPNSGSDAPPTCPPCPRCPTATTIPAIPCPLCPICPTCETCARIDYQDISTARPTIENSAYQKGFFDMKKRCMEDTGQKPPKFSEAPTSGAPGFLQGGDNSLVCFRWFESQIGHAFPLNYSTWNVRNESGQGRWYIWEKERNTSAISAFRDEVRQNETGDE